jgi:hypothetical protein
LGFQLESGLYCWDIGPNQEQICQHCSCIEAKDITKYCHTPLSLIGACHCPESPCGPKIECLERVSSFGRIIFKDLQEASKRASKQDTKGSTYDPKSNFFIVTYQKKKKKTHFFIVTCTVKIIVQKTNKI